MATREIPAALDSLKQLDGVEDCCILTTCNRFEVIFLLHEETDPREIFGQYLQSLHGISHNKIEDTKEEHLELCVTAFDNLAQKAMNWVQSPRRATQTKAP